MLRRPIIIVLLAAGGFLSMLAGSCHGPEKQWPFTIQIDTLAVDFDIEQIYENSWVNGVSFINSGGSLYLCMFKDRSTLLLANLFKRGDELEIPINGTVNTFSSRNNTLLYITEEDYSTCHLLRFDSGNYKMYRTD